VCTCTEIFLRLELFSQLFCGVEVTRRNWALLTAVINLPVNQMKKKWGESTLPTVSGFGRIFPLFSAQRSASAQIDANKKKVDGRQGSDVKHMPIRIDLGR
jgi:predicted Zn-dependent protease